MSDHSHIFELFDPSKYIAAFELDGKDVTVTIARIVGEEVEGEEGRKNKHPVVHFTDYPKPMVLNKTNAKMLMKLFRTADYRSWAGKRFTVYPTTTKFGREKVDAIRIRETIPPAAKSAPAAQPELPLAERAAALKTALKGAKTKEALDSLWSHSKARKIREELDAEPEQAVLNDLTLQYELRGTELEAPV